MLAGNRNTNNNYIKSSNNDIAFWVMHPNDPQRSQKVPLRVPMEKALPTVPSGASFNANQNYQPAFCFCLCSCFDVPSLW